MVTLFTTPKPFTNRHTAIIQRNAIMSWKLLRPRPQIFLLGDEPDTVQICNELKLSHLPGVRCNEFGTPLLNDLFGKAQEAASFPLLVYVNADIILMSDFMEAIQKLNDFGRPFLAFGQRWDVDMGEPMYFDAPDWEKRLKEYAIRSRPKGPLWGLADYFIFSRGLYKEIPPFAIGRTAFDNWLIYSARVLGVPVIDITQAVMAVHQKHDYLHQAHRPRGWEEISKGVEAQRNQILSGGKDYNEFSLYDATHLLTPNGFRKAIGAKYLVRSLDTAAVLHPYLLPLKWLSNLKTLLTRGLHLLKPRDSNSE